MIEWCNTMFRNRFVRECPVLGPGILTIDPKLCANIAFWRKQTCGSDWIRCLAGYSGQCVPYDAWGVEGDEHRVGSCQDGSDKYRPIKQLTQEQQLWKTRPVREEDYNERYKGTEEGVKYKKDDSTGLWMTTTTDEACKSKGFVCKVKFNFFNIFMP